jgi:hypothetical protein
VVIWTGSKLDISSSHSSTEILTLGISSNTGIFFSLPNGDFLIEAILLMVSNISHIDNYHNGWINNDWFYGLLVGQREFSYKCCSYILYLRHVGLLACLFPADKLTTCTVV